ncbi:heat shock factor protein-like [Babylonia areolata]|uniref:heat shock factor protein-like n=1 Tax=Babylonia areolata TaxID=304850 RepID=UPI003FD404C8
MRMNTECIQQFEDKMAAKRSGREPDYEYFSFQENSGSGNVPAFLSKLWILVEDPSNNEIICWDAEGTSFHIYDQSRFAAEVLPYYFKHNNISSFIRQLNMYGFRKVPNMEQGGLKVERDDVEFQHQFFVRGHEELLDRIKRKTGQARTEQRPVSLDRDSLAKVLSEVSQIKNKQDSFNTTMEDLKRENQILWREVIKLTKKYQQQQQIISKIMHFLLSLVNKHGRGMPGISRKRPLMINAAPEPSNPSEAPPAKKANIVLNEAGDHDYTVQSPASIQSAGVASTSSGVVIQELLDHLEPPLESPAPQTSGSFSLVSEGIVPPTPQTDTQTSSPSMPLLTTTVAPPDPATIVTEVLLPAGTSSQAVLPAQPTKAPTTVTLQPQQQGQTSGQRQQHQQQPQPVMTSQQIALRGVKDKPLSSSSSSVSTPKDMSEQMRMLQCDLDNVREVLSSGQFNLDPNFILGLFDPETPLPVNIDASLLDLQPSESSPADLQTSSISAQLPASTPETISGNELSQYQPADLSLPSLFDELDTDVPAAGEESMPLFFDNSEDSALHTPTAVHETQPSLSDMNKFISVEDLD